MQRRRLRLLLPAPWPKTNSMPSSSFRCVLCVCMYAWTREYFFEYVFFYVNMFTYITQHPDGPAGVCCVMCVHVYICLFTRVNIFTYVYYRTQRPALTTGVCCVHVCAREHVCKGMYTCLLMIYIFTYINQRPAQPAVACCAYICACKYLCVCVSIHLRM